MRYRHVPVACQRGPALYLGQRFSHVCLLSRHGVHRMPKATDIGSMHVLSPVRKVHGVDGLRTGTMPMLPRVSRASLTGPVRPALPTGARAVPMPGPTSSTPAGTLSDPYGPGPRERLDHGPARVNTPITRPAPGGRAGRAGAPRSRGPGSSGSASIAPRSRMTCEGSHFSHTTDRPGPAPGRASRGPLPRSTRGTRAGPFPQVRAPRSRQRARGPNRPADRTPGPRGTGFPLRSGNRGQSGNLKNAL